MSYIKRRRGSNQYSIIYQTTSTPQPIKRSWLRRYFFGTPQGSILVLWFIALSLCLSILGVQEAKSRMTVAFASESLVVSGNKVTSKLQTENTDMEKELIEIKAKYPNPTDKEIESYIKTIFGKDSKTAIGIAHHECWTWSKEFPGCIHHSDFEHSVGVFQINLYNKKQNVQADRIPGANMTQKEEWLKNPFNNTLYAYWLSTKSGFFPWTTFTSGAYLK